MENYNYKSRYYLMLGISILCLVFLVGSATYAFFKPIIQGTGTPIDVNTGKVNLEISNEQVVAGDLLPIKDDSKDTKAWKNDFTITRKNDADYASKLNACYTLYLVVDNIGERLKSKWFKYELSYLDSENQTQTIEGTFESLASNPNVSVDKNNKFNIGLLENQELSDENPSNSYTLRLWLSYSTNPEDDQSSILVKNKDESDEDFAESRRFSAHVYASGANGKCKVTN